jgi:hypothetical protein
MCAKHFVLCTAFANLENILRALRPHKQILFENWMLHGTKHPNDGVTIGSIACKMCVCEAAKCSALCVDGFFVQPDLPWKPPARVLDPAACFPLTMARQLWKRKMR